MRRRSRWRRSTRARNDRRSFRDGALAPDPESRDSGFDASHRPGMTENKEIGMAFRQRRERLRSILNGPSCIRPGSVYDATSIRIAEDLGFELGMFGGSVASLV